jgi:hypothetical protein
MARPDPLLRGLSLDPPRPRRLRIPLNTAMDVQKQLAKVYREYHAGVIDEPAAKCKTYILVSLHRVIEGSDLERRIAELEEARSGGS